MSNVITGRGAELIRELLAGNKKLIFTRAVGGDGVCTDSELPALTALPSENQTLALTDMISDSNGPRLSVRVSSNGLQSAYTLRQIGVYAKLDDNGTETLLQVAQVEPEINIPAQSDTVGMTLDLSIGIAVDIGDAAVIIDNSAYVTTRQLHNTVCDVVRTRNSVNFIIQNNAWESENAGVFTGPYWKATVLNDRFSNDYFPLVTFDPEIIREGAQYGLSSECDMRDGKLYLYAIAKPEVTIYGTCRMLITESPAISGAAILNGGSGNVGDNGTWGGLFPSQ